MNKNRNLKASKIEELGLKEKVPKVKHGLYLPETVLSDFKEIAETQGCSINELMVKVLEKWLQEIKGKAS
jgi:hypothetical protein